MKSNIFGAFAIAGMIMSSAAMAEEGKAPGKKHEAKAAHGGWCKSNECKGQVAGAKNECKGHMACKGIDQAKCEEGGKGTWDTTEPKPK